MPLLTFVVPVLWLEHATQLAYIASTRQVVGCMSVASSVKALRACCVLSPSAALESVVVASMGPRLLTLRLGDYPGEPLVVYGNARTDRAVSCISALPDCLGAAVGDQEHGAALWLYNQSPYEQLEDPTQYLMGSQVRRPVTSCLSLLQLSDTVMPAPRQVSLLPFSLRAEQDLYVSRHGRTLTASAILRQECCRYPHGLGDPCGC